MLKHQDTINHYLKKINIFHLFAIPYAILLVPIAFLLRGMVVGLMGLLLVISSGIRYLTPGGLISAAWTSCVMILTFFVSPFEIYPIHVIGGILIYFLIGLGLGRHAMLMRNNQKSIDMQNSALVKEKNQFETLFKSSFDAIVLLDKNHLILDVNQNFVKLFGYKPKDIIGMNLDDVLDKGKGGSANRELTQKLIFNGEQVLAEATRYSREGRPIEVVIKAVPIIIDGEITGGYAIYDDITYRKYYEKQLEYLGFHDQLTDLYNRSSFEHHLNELSGGNNYPISIVTADLNGLKLINDTIGHQSGDDLLKASANILKNTIGHLGRVFRIGGDEFAIVLPSTNEDTCEKIANEIHASIKNYNSDRKIAVSLSIGASTAKNKDISLKEVFKRADDLMYREKLYEGTSVRAQVINALMATLSERDHITEGHAQRLDDLCMKIGKRSGLPPHRLANLTLLSQVHDLGKVGIPDNILFKTGPLVDKEWEIMQLHPEKGYRIALSSPDLSGVADLILKHHERWDGTGYPLGLKGKEIPIECRILTIVDAFDAMTNDRPYSKARSEKEAIEEIKHCSGTQFDPVLVEIFLSILEA